MEVLLEYVKRMPGHRNSKGESAPWVIVSHKTGKVLSSHKTKTEAEEHLKQMHIFKERHGYHNRGRVLEEATYYYVRVPNEEEEHEFHSASEAKRFMMAHEGSVGQMVRVRANGEWEPVGEIKLRGRNSYKMSNRDSYRYESSQRRGRMLKEVRERVGYDEREERIFNDVGFNEEKRTLISNFIWDVNRGKYRSLSDASLNYDGSVCVSSWYGGFRDIPADEVLEFLKSNGVKESRRPRGRMLKESSWPMEPEDLNDLCSEKADEIVAKRNGIITDKRGIFLDAYLEKHHPELELEREWTYERLLEIVDDDGYFHRRDLARLENELDKDFPPQG